MEYWEGGYNRGNPKSGKVLKIIFAVFFVVGAALLITGIVLMVNKNKKIKRCSGEAKGTVIELDGRTHTDSDTGHISEVYAPIVEYTVNGETYREMNDIHTSPCNYTVGQTIIVRYDPSDPSVMILEGDSGMKFLYYLFIGMGSVYVVIALIILAVDRAKKG